MALPDLNAFIEKGLVHEIHTSERKSFRACRRRWDWIFNQNYYPFITAKPLEFGVAFHIAMEVFYDPDMWDWPRDVVAKYAIKRFVDKAEQQRKNALEASGEQYLDDDVQKDYDERVELGKGMLSHYFQNIAPVRDIGWRPVKVEIPFMVPIPHPDTGEVMWCKCSRCQKAWAHYYEIPASKKDRTQEQLRFIKENWLGLPIVLAGRVDMIAEDDNHDLWVVDWKSARMISRDDEFLYLDDQIGGYTWALRMLGLNVRGFVYHEQRKGYPKPPERNKVTRLGRRFSVNQQQETDYETYLKTVSEEDTEAYRAGLYDDFLAFLKNEGITYYARYQIHKSDDELDEIGFNLGLEALEMTDPHLRIYPNPGRFGCNTCAFRVPCVEQNAKGDYQYALDTLFDKRKHYWVREESSTETKGGM